jgi:hypothetical protein
MVNFVFKIVLFNYRTILDYVMCNIKFKLLINRHKYNKQKREATGASLSAEI